MADTDLPPSPTPRPSGKAERELLDLSRDRFRWTADAEHDMRKDALDDDEFRAGEQWPADLKLRREQDGRPCLTIDKLSQPIRQVTNRQRQARPAIQINPVSGGADQATAEIQQGLIRQIEADSYADVAYDWAFDGAVSRGWGYLRILTEYEAPESFDQILKIEWIENPYTVYRDPTVRQWNGSDARWCHIVQDLMDDEYEARFGKGTAKATLSGFASLGDQANDWFPEGKIRIAEYFYDEPETYTLVQLSTGEAIDKEVLPKRLPKGLKVVQEREATRHRIKWCLHNAIEVLESRDWAGQYIPIIRVEGERLNQDGKRILRGLVRPAKHSQRMYNYWVSTATETTALAPRAPYLMYEGQDEGYEAMWQQANVKAFSALKVRATTKQTGGTLLPLPQRIAIEPPIQAMMAGVNQAEQDIRSLTGFYDATDPRRANTEQSGRAILTRQAQGAETNGNFLDNLGRSLRFVGEILLDLLPKIYDRPGRVVQILGMDDEMKEVMLGAPFQPGQPAAPGGRPEPPQPLPDGQPFIKGLHQFYDVSQGRYAVTVTVGASYSTRRQEGVASMLELLRATPEVAPFMTDVLVKNMDWPGAPQLAKRLEKMLPPPLQEEGKGGPSVQQLQQQLQQITMQHEALTKALAQQTEIVKSDAAANASKERIAADNNRSREQIAALNARVQMLITAEKLRSQGEVAALQTELQRVLTSLDQASEQMMQNQDLAFDAQALQTQLAAPTPPQEAPAGESPAAPPAY